MAVGSGARPAPAQMASGCSPQRCEGKAMDRDTSRLFEEFDDAPRASSELGTALDVTIRPARVGDAGDIGRISADREGRDPEEEIAAVERSLRSDCVGPSRVVFVAEVDGSVVGFGRAQYRESEPDVSDGGLPVGWYLAGVVVNPRFRRRGIGTRLTAARLSWIAERGTAVYYFANAMNRVSVALHEGFGFVEVARGPSFGAESFVGGEGILFKAEFGGPERRAP
jgi:GNAT superfamily N-acetyltransferase